MDKIYCRLKFPKYSKKKALLMYFENKCPATFWNKDFSNIQCLQRKNRSIGDMKMLLDGHFKTKTPVEHVINMLMDLAYNKKIKSLFCPNINKIVFFNNHRPYYYFVGGGAPRHGAIGTDGYSWENLVENYKNKQ